MELDTLWSMALWAFGAAIASPFIIFGLLLVGTALFIAFDIVGFIGFGLYYILKFVYNLVLCPFGKSTWQKEANKEPKIILDIWDGNPEDGVHPTDTDYKNCGEWIRLYDKYSGNKEVEVK